MKVVAHKISHPGGNFYAFAVAVPFLEKVCYVRARTSKNREAIQREITPKRLKDIGDFYDSSDMILPNALILVSEKPLKPKKIDGNLYKINLPEDKDSIWVLDGQHRLLGYKNSKEKKPIELLVSIFEPIKNEERAKLFVKINSTQKSLSASLIYDLLSLTNDADFKKIASHKIVKSLNYDNNSPWKSCIKMTGKGEGHISQAAMISNLLDLYNESDVFRIMEEPDKMTFLKNYFIVIKTLFKKEWGSKDHILTKTLGLAAFMKLSKDVLEKCAQDENISKKYIKKHIENLKGFDLSSEKLGASSSRKAQKNLYKKLLAVVDPSKNKSTYKFKHK